MTDPSRRPRLIGACALALLSVLGVACASADGAATTAALASDDVPAQGEALLERRADGAALYGRLEPAPADTDSPRVLILRTALGGHSLDAALDGARVLDARFAAGGIVTIGADHVLRLHADGVATALDTEAEAPLSVAGSVVAYARGTMPAFELARADLVTGVARQWTDGMAPVWSPALSRDASEVVFVSGAGGTPRLYRVGRSGSPALLPETGRFPSSLRAPLWEGATLTFEDELGTPCELQL